MQYMGGKARQAKYIREIVAKMRGDRDHYLEPFMGGASVAAAVAPDFPYAVLADASAPLVALWRSTVMDGWLPPETLTREEYNALRSSEEVNALRGWAAYGASYQGKFFAGFNGEASHRNYLAENRRGLERKAAALRAHPALFIMHADYRGHAVSDRTVVYCDPPYAGTTGYGAIGDFDHVEFWTTAQTWAEKGALVLVHEYSAPDGWAPVLTTYRTEVMDRKSSGKRAEILYVYTG